MAVVRNDLVCGFMQLVVDQSRKFIVSSIFCQKLMDQLIVFVTKSDLKIVAVGPASLVNFDKVEIRRLGFEDAFDQSFFIGQRNAVGEDEVFPLHKFFQILIYVQALQQVFAPVFDIAVFSFINGGIKTVGIGFSFGHSNELIEDVDFLSIFKSSAPFKEACLEREQTLGKVRKAGKFDLHVGNLQGNTSIHTDDSAIDVSRIVRSQEGIDSRYFFGLAKALQRHFGFHFIEDFRRHCI